MKLVAVDMDGTLLRSDCTVSDYSKDVLRRTPEEKILVVPTSGRCFRSMKAQLDDVPQIRYYNCSNGSVLVDSYTGEILHNHIMPKEYAYKIFCFIKENGGCAEVYSGLDTYTEKDTMYIGMDSPGTRDLFSDLFSTTIPVDRLDDKIESGELEVNKFNMMFPNPSYFLAMEEMLDCLEEIEYAYPTPFNMEIFYTGSNKDTGLRMIAQKHQIPHGDTYAIGDSGNDLSMCQYAGTSLAVANAMYVLACEVDQIIGSNDEDGPAKYIEELM